MGLVDVCDVTYLGGTPTAIPRDANQKRERFSVEGSNVSTGLPKADACPKVHGET